jgi:hypothetical protein
LLLAKGVPDTAELRREDRSELRESVLELRRSVPREPAMETAAAAAAWAASNDAISMSASICSPFAGT